jgi:hypothetical protein
MSVPDEQRRGSGSGSGDPGTTPDVGAGRVVGVSPESRPGPGSLRDMLAGYDREVEDSLREALDCSTGVGRVRSLHNSVRRSISVHDAVLESALCPLLEDLPGGPPVAERLRLGCQERARLLARFEEVSHNVAAHNVYPVSGEEIEHILEGLEHSFGEHVSVETTSVSSLLEDAAGSIDPDVVEARMEIEARQAPTRVHAATARHPSSGALKAFYRSRDRFRDWSDTHWGWTDPRATRRSPREQQVDLLRSRSTSSAPSVRDLLTGYDAIVEQLIVELRSAPTESDRMDAAYRLNSAIAVHDSVLGGVLCPLLEAVSGGEPLAVRLREGCLQRAELQSAWNALTKGVGSDDPVRLDSAEAGSVIEALMESFLAHQREESLEVIALLEQQPGSAYRTNASPFNDAMWPWYSEGPGLLALRMALWAHSGPTHAHPRLVRHPTSRVLRTWFHVVDGFRDHWDDSALGRWLSPTLPSRPFSGQPRQGDTGSVVPTTAGPSVERGAERRGEAGSTGDG